MKDALDTFISVFDAIEKFPITDKFIKLIFVLTVPYGRPFMVVTLIVFTFNKFIDAFIRETFDAFIFVADTFVKDAFDTFIRVFDVIEKFSVTDKFVKLMFVLTVP